ncbi:hypothetical protein [Spirillospora sp. NPDC047279]|uniref:hypothetical protein n=1 Tax=Spirillospora sp. NPDC047279 TaxID=3155478 RepID=UPI0033C8E368
MTVLHADYGRVWQLDAPETMDDTEVSSALQELIDSGIVDLENGIEFCYGSDTEFKIELIGPWQGSDYSGDDVNESNQRSLLRDFPDLLINDTRWWGHCGYGLQIQPDFGSDSETAEQAEELVKILIGLKHDYPLYDEQDNGELIQERAQEAWDSWLRMDTESEIQKLTGLSIELGDMEDEFWELLSEHQIYPEAEGHRDVRFEGLKDESFVLALAVRGVELGHFDRDEVEDLTDTGYALLGAWINATYEWPLKGQMSVFEAL